MIIDLNFPLLLAFFVAAFSSLFTIMNPISTASIFLTISRGDSKEKKVAMARKACFTAAMVLIVFALAGSFILSFFSITLDAFKIAGGIIIGSVGLKMIYAKREHLHSEKEKKEAIQKSDVSIIPLAIPMLSGPGAMTTAIVLMGEAKYVADVGVIILAIVIVCILSFIILSKADLIDKYLGENGRNVIDRIMGLIVLVVGVQFIVNGIDGLLLGWAQHFL